MGAPFFMRFKLQRSKSLTPYNLPQRGQQKINGYFFRLPADK